MGEQDDHGLGVQLNGVQWVVCGWTRVWKGNGMCVRVRVWRRSNESPSVRIHHESKPQGDSEVNVLWGYR